MRKTLFTVLYAIVSSCMFGQNFEVSPASIEFNAEPGESQSRIIIVKNHSSKSETYILSISDYSVNSKGKGQYLEAGSIKQSIADWLTFAPIFFELQPNEEKEINVSIQVPNDEIGSKWGTLFIKTANEQTTFDVDKSVQTGINVSGRMAIPIYQTPANNKAYQATISNLMEIESNSDSLRIFSALINNLGEIITNCKVYLIATDIQMAEETSFDATAFTIFPKSSRKIEIEMPRILPKGTYSLAAILDYGSATNLEGTQIVITVE